MKTKKILSFFCSVAMLCTMFTAFPMTASAAGTAIDVSDINTLQKKIDNASGPTVINIIADLKAADAFNSIAIPNGKNITINLNSYTIECKFYVTSVDTNTDLTINGPGAIKGNKYYSDSITYSNPAVIVDAARALTAKLTANNVNFIGADFANNNSQGASAIKADFANIYLNNCYVTAGKSNGTAGNAYAIEGDIEGNKTSVYTKDCTFVRGTGGSGTNPKTITGCDVYDLDSKQSITVDTTKSPLIIGKGYTKKPITQDNGAIAMDKTPVTANATIPAPIYTVTIPETVSLGDQKQALEKYRRVATDQFGKAVVVSKDFTVSATGVANLFNDLDDNKADYINVTATFDGTLKGSKNAEKTVPYTLSQNSTTLANGAKIATFYNDVDLASKGKTNSATATITMNRADIKNADSYQGTMTFTIAVANR